MAREGGPSVCSVRGVDVEFQSSSWSEEDRLLLSTQNSPQNIQSMYNGLAAGALLRLELTRLLREFPAVDSIR